MLSPKDAIAEHTISLKLTRLQLDSFNCRLVRANANVSRNLSSAANEIFGPVLNICAQALLTNRYLRSELRRVSMNGGVAYNRLQILFPIAQRWFAVPGDVLAHGIRALRNGVDKGCH